MSLQSLSTPLLSDAPYPAAPWSPETGPGPQFPGTVLADLVHHRSTVEASTPLAVVQKMLQHDQADFLAIVENAVVVGLCSRATVGFMLSSRFGFALNGSRPVLSACAPRPLIYPADTPLPQVLDEALSRTGSEFFEDIIITRPDGSLIGLVPVPRLARLQLHLFGEQLNRVVAQDQELRQHNLELFQINSQLRQSQGRYKALFENNALGVALLTPAGAIVAHNQRFAQLLQLAEGPPPPVFLLERWIEPGDRPAWRSLLAAHESRAPETEPRVTELRFELLASTRLFELHSSWVVETGQICVFLEDITEQRSLEQRMAQQEKQGMLDTLVAGVAHELNNKLTPVLGFAELLQSVAPEEFSDHTRCIQQSAQEAAQIVRQLLSLSRPEKETFALFDLSQLCRDTVQMLRFQFRAANCEVTLHLPPGNTPVQGDAAQVRQVLINLMLNALHALENQAEPRVTLSLLTNAGSVSLRVRDNGCGIKPEIINRIFDPFFTTKGTHGTGLGLSISASIIREHGWDLSVESAPGKGATFVIRLPAATAALQPVISDAPAPSSPAATSSRRRVLIVDDEEFVRQYVQEALRLSFGCSIDTAEDGLEAVAKLEQGISYDVILSDVRMPRMDGLQLRSWITGHRADLSARVIFLTGHAGAGGLDQAMGQLGCPVIRKPFTLDALHAACRSYLL